MLRSARPRGEISKSFICYRCLSSLRSGSIEGLWLTASTRPVRRLSPRHQNGTAVHLRSKRLFGVYTAQRSNTVPNLSVHPPSQQKPPPLDFQQIKLQTIERLRQWEAEHASTFAVPKEFDDSRPPGEVCNAWTRRGNVGFMVDPNVGDTSEDVDTKVFGRDELLDVGNDRLFLRPGDLVELLSMEGVDRELAIYIGHFDTQSQFYTMSGSWVHRHSQFVLFSSPHFVQPHELDALRPYLPEADVPLAMQDKLHRLSQLVPRSAGQSLIRKMLDFWTQADAVYQANSARLDSAHQHVAHLGKFRYATLDEIASDLLPDIARNAEDGKIPNPVLYAVHRCLLMDGVGFRAPLKRTLRAGGQYEIVSIADMMNIKLVRNIVRRHMDSKFAERSNTTPPHMLRGYARLDRFVAKAQRRIDISRKTRQFTPHGTVGPISAKLGSISHEKLGPLKDDFDDMDMKIIQFLESWSALRYFKDFSPLNGTAASILRAVNRYGEDIILHQVTGWTFLQEIGAIAPWECRAAFDMRLPNTGLSLSTKPGPTTFGFVPDKLKDIRKDWGDLPVYCVDSSDSHEIDDGISIEQSDTPGQYWLHIHTADPGAHIDPASPVAQYADELGLTVYMPDRVVTMLPSSFVRANLSLAPDRPCLTYSAKITTDGELLDYKVTAGIIHNVRHITPRVVEESVLQSSFSKKSNFYFVGPDLPRFEPRRMVKADELSDLDKENFRLLHKIGEGHTERRISRGSILYGNFKDFSASASINSSNPTKKIDSATYHIDPSIQISTEVVESSVQLSREEEFFDVVQPAMLIAGEVAARWCKDRGIPIIHRLTARNVDREDPAEFFVKNVLPTRNEQGSFDFSQEKAFFNLVGAVQPSTTPGPHISMGLEMFARCTSPLRRYTDLLLQWQVESALLEEARLGHSLVGNTRDDFLPHTKSQIDACLPRIDARERLVAYATRRAEMHWLNHLLLRAWKYGEVAIPCTFSFVIRGVDGNNEKSFIRGAVDHFQAKAVCTCPGWSDITEFKVGDILEVEIDDINIYHYYIRFRALRRMDAAQKDALDKKNSLAMQSRDII